MTDAHHSSYTIARHQEHSYTLENGRQFNLSFTAAVGEFHRNFVTNVRVESFPDEHLIRTTVAIDKSKPNFAHFVRDAVVRAKSPHLFEKMRHTLLDFNEIPPHIEQPLINNMARFAIAQSVGAVDMFAGSTARTFIPMGITYNQRIRQQYVDLHDRIFKNGRLHGSRPARHVA